MDEAAASIGDGAPVGGHASTSGPLPHPTRAGPVLDPPPLVPILKVHAATRTTPTPTAAATDAPWLAPALEAEVTLDTVPAAATPRLHFGPRRQQHIRFPSLRLLRVRTIWRVGTRQRNGWLRSMKRPGTPARCAPFTSHRPRLPSASLVSWHAADRL